MHDSYRDVRLTPRGKRAAQQVLRRFEVLHRFLTEVLGLGDSAARRDACEIEHIVGTETMERLTAFLEYVGTCRHNVPAVIDHFQSFFALRAVGDPCSECEAAKLVGRDKTKMC
jgi:Mn-dependent DtxR family transcriptional regulator